MTGITIPASVTEIVIGAFQQCSSLSSVIFESNSSLKLIGDYAFYKATSLTALTIPASVTSLGNYAFQDCNNGPLGWVGRVAPEKGLEDAAYVANALGEKLKVWGIIQDQSYALKIEKSLSPGILEWKGFLETEELQKELGTCRALLNTPKWNEAYGNVVVEALACGVPVVAYKRGGPSEIIEHGRTGYLAIPDDKESLLGYLKVINKIDRKLCREWVENNASSNIFASRVVKWLSMIIKENQF